MSQLEVDPTFDVHDHREDLKLIAQSDDTFHLKNRSGCICPACGDTFDRLFVASSREATFENPPTSPICLYRTDDQLLMTTHPDGN
jgi:hypothetical protein